MANDDIGWHIWQYETSKFLLFPPEPEKADIPAISQWCLDAQLLVEWADILMEQLVRDPNPKRLDWAKKELSDRYYWAYKGAEKDHRPEHNLDSHPCVHQAYVMILEKLDRLRIATGPQEMEPPPVRIIDQTEAPERKRSQEIDGSVIATGQDDFS